MRRAAIVGEIGDAQRDAVSKKIAAYRSGLAVHRSRMRLPPGALSVPLSTDTPLGTTRVDNLLRISIGPGWQFTSSWSAVLGYRYLTNLSNKQPYVRQIYGLIVEGAF